MIEYEGKILEVNPVAIHKRVVHCGGHLVSASNQRRYVYDIVPGDQTRWIRLRDNGTTVTLATKQIHHDGLDGTEEHEVAVEDFDATHRLLESMGFTAKGYQENRRTSYSLQGAQVEVDEWPMIPAYLEVEGRSRDHVIDVAVLLGFEEADLTGENTTAVYRRYGIDLPSIPVLTF